MDLKFQLATLAIILEFSLVAIAIVITYILYLFYYFKKRRIQKIKKNVMHYFSQLILARAIFTPENFPKAWQRLDVLVPVLNRFEKLIDNLHWEDKRTLFIRVVLLPLARTSSLSLSWVFRYYAAVAFSFIAEKKDETYIVKLANDSVRLVYLTSIKAALECQSEMALNMIIVRMISEPKITQTTYLQAFDHVSNATRPFVVKHLNSTTDPNARATCYRILLKYPSEKITWDLSADVFSDNLSLKITTIRFIAHVKEVELIPVLIDLLNQEKIWEVKAVCIQCLCDLNAENAIPVIIRYLQDPNWWVRLIAKQVLSSFADKGYPELHHLDLEVDPGVVNVTQYILNTL